MDDAPLGLWNVLRHAWLSDLDHSTICEYSRASEADTGTLQSVLAILEWTYSFVEHFELQ